MARIQPDGEQEQWTQLRGDEIARRLNALAEEAERQCRECEGYGLKRYPATRVTDTCPACNGSGKRER